MVAAVCCFKRFFKNKNPTPKNIVFYLNPPIMAKQEHLDVGTRNNLAPLFWAFAVSPLGQRGVSRGISGENTRTHTHAQWQHDGDQTHLRHATPLAQTALGYRQTPAATFHTMDEEPSVSAPTISLSSSLSHVL